jgi:protein MPE1
MASSVFYKFRSQREESRVTFDGTGISVFDLKKEIILANNLGKANDFDLFVYDSSTNQGESWFRRTILQAWP